ncbi:SUF system Fe-S cluster assembly protein [Postechiella marina]|mgnify:CR=1 FL=1|uniref:SUF system Fe-S cluster assembly protein n=2 Tax=Postechiella marina TaxID=943941 RepID=A0ABP8C4G7_9FLAO
MLLLTKRNLNNNFVTVQTAKQYFFAFAKKKFYTMSETIDTAELGEKIVNVLKTIYDPEIPVDIYELGLIYDVFVNEDYDVKILMTLTTPNCPVAETLPLEVEEKVKSLNAVKDAEVEITFDPPWTQELMSEEAKLELGML